MWSDNETDFDLLDVRHLVAAVTTTVTDQRLLPATLGVYGAWGSGKSSVILMARAELQRDESILCVTFNGWQFEGYEDAKAALMGSVLDAILVRQSLAPKALELGKKLLKRVDWFRLLGWAGKSVITLTTGLPTFGVGALAGAARDAITAAPKKLEGLDVEEAKKLLKEAPDGLLQRARRMLPARFAAWSHPARASVITRAGSSSERAPVGEGGTTPFSDC
ncbi:MAG: KAP family P-loop NTPase fold protein [Woeseiaceae bacterium]